MGTISYTTAGSNAANTVDGTVAFPATVTAGQYALCYVAWKRPTGWTPTTLSGWTLLTTGNAGAGAAGGDAGPVGLAVYGLECAGTEDSSTVNIGTVGGTTPVWASRIFLFTKTSGTWNVAADDGSDTSVDTSWSVTVGSDIGIQADDMVVAFLANNSDGQTFSAQALSASGVTFDTVTALGLNATALGEDLSAQMWYALVTAGPSSGAATATATASGSTTNSPTGMGSVVRLRAVDSAGGSRVLFRHYEG